MLIVMCVPQQDPVLGLRCLKAPNSTGKITSSGSFDSAPSSAVSLDKSARRFAQDDGFVGVLTKNISNRLAVMGSSPGRFRSPLPGVDFQRAAGYSTRRIRLFGQRTRNTLDELAVPESELTHTLNSLERRTSLGIHACIAPHQPHPDAVIHFALPSTPA